MELLSYPKTEYLLDSSLESLHGDAMAWLNELTFWRDEMTFYYKLLHHLHGGAAFPTIDLAEMEKEMVRLTSSKIDKVRVAVADHEHALFSLMKSPSGAREDEYRAAHRRILGDMHDVHLDLRAFKKKVFSFVQKD